MALKSRSMNHIAINGEIKPILDRVIVRDMHFKEIKTPGGIIMISDDGTDLGIKPRWGKVVAKGEDNKDEYNVGDWILIEHGRWSRGYAVDMGEDDPVVLRTVDAACVLLWSNEEPKDMSYQNNMAIFNRQKDVGQTNFDAARPGMPGLPGY